MKYVADAYFSKPRNNSVNFYKSNEQDAKPDKHIRMCLRIWSGFTKFIRSQCNKDRVVDSIYFGNFVKVDENN